MTSKNTAEVIETSLKRTALGLSLLTLSFGMSLLAYFSDGEVVDNIKIAQKVISFFVIVIVLPAFYNMMKIRMGNKAQCNDIDNYIAETFRYAGVFAFSITFVALIALEIINRNIGQELPTIVYLQSAKFITIGSFTSYFYLKLHRDKFDEAEDDFSDEEAQ